MVYKEERRDLFEISHDYFLAHCISSDYALGAGIAVEFNKKFDMRYKLKTQAKGYWEHAQANGRKGDCVLIDRVLNLITKEKYWHKPTYESMRHALEAMRMVCGANQIDKVAMPIIGCGLDKLQWDKVSEIIKDVFQYEDIEILVCVR